MKSTEKASSTKPETYVCKDGDTFVTIAAKHKPANKTLHEYATELYEKNRGLILITGLEVQL